MNETDVERQVMELKKICKFCGKEFTTESKSKMYCSRSCVVKASKVRRGFNIINEQRKINCKLCGKEFLTKNGKSKYCSDECRKKVEKIYRANLKKSKKEQKLMKARAEGYKARMREMAEINAKARAEGLSWGQYVTKYKLY